jgi:hypothetical protein
VKTTANNGRASKKEEENNIARGAREIVEPAQEASAPAIFRIAYQSQPCTLQSEPLTTASYVLRFSPIQAW